MSTGKHVAILLAGCGVYDGSECTEAVSTILHLERTGCTFQAFAPNKDQAHTVDHTTGSASDAPARNVMVESARIVRGNIRAASEFDVTEYDALLIPGGFGAMKNLCNYALDGVDVNSYEVDDNVRKMMEDCLRSKTPMGLSCIAPMLLPKITLSESDANIDANGISMTLGKSEGDDFPYAGTIQDAKSLGVIRHVECDNTDVVVDDEHKIVTAPAFMQDAGYYAVYTNIGQMVDAIVEMMTKETAVE